MAATTENPTSNAEASITASVDKGSAALNEAVDTATRRGQEVLSEAEDAVTNLDNAVRDFVREKPYTALAIAGFAGFLYAVIRRS